MPNLASRSCVQPDRSAAPVARQVFTLIGIDAFFSREADPGSDADVVGFDGEDVAELDPTS